MLRAGELSSTAQSTSLYAIVWVAPSSTRLSLPRRAACTLALLAIALVLALALFIPVLPAFKPVLAVAALAVSVGDESTE